MHCFPFLHWIKFCSGWDRFFSFGWQKSACWSQLTGGRLIQQQLYGIGLGGLSIGRHRWVAILQRWLYKQVWLYAGLLVLHLLLFSCQILASLSLFCRYYFGRGSSELAELVPLPFFGGRSTHYFDRLHDFSVTIPWCYKDVYVNSFFPRTTRLWNSLSIECFPLTYDLNDLELTDTY